MSLVWFGWYEEDGAGSGGCRDCVTNPPQFQTNSNVWEVPKKPIQKQALETSQADPPGWELPELPSWWTHLQVLETFYSFPWMPEYHIINYFKKMLRMFWRASKVVFAYCVEKNIFLIWQ